MQVALVNLLRSWGVLPGAVVGHSSGEIAAAYAARSISDREAIIIAYYRGYATKFQSRAGGMAAVGLGKDTMMPYLTPGLVIACENSPSSVTISGDIVELDKLLGKLKEENPNVFSRRLQVEMAYHSRKCHPPYRNTVHVVLILTKY